MKQIIEMLAQAYGIIRENLIGDEDDINMVCNLIAGAVADLNAPRWETPEQREKRTGEELPDDWAVYYRVRYRPSIYDAETWTIWRVGKHKSIKKRAAHRDTQCVCAGDAGPPPDDWESEGGEKKSVSSK